MADLVNTGEKGFEPLTFGVRKKNINLNNW